MEFALTIDGAMFCVDCSEPLVLYHDKSDRLNIAAGTILAKLCEALSKLPTAIPKNS